MTTVRHVDDALVVRHDRRGELAQLGSAERAEKLERECAQGAGLAIREHETLDR
jgi:hypothetical protein